MRLRTQDGGALGGMNAQVKGGPSWGATARPGTAQVYVFEGCRDDRIVAGVIRMEKGHTEGLEPRITEEILMLMLSAKGGKLNGG